MASVQELEKGVRDAMAAGNIPDAVAFNNELVKLKNSGGSQPGVLTDQEYQARQVHVNEGIFAERIRSAGLIGAMILIVFILILGWGKWKSRLKGISLESVWIVSKCALAIATTVLIMNLIHDRPWLWFLRH